MFMSTLIPFNRKYTTALPVGFESFYNMLDDFFADGPSARRSLTRDTFKIDVEETPENFKIQAELPGIKKEEIRLDLEEGKLTITVKREENAEEEKRNYIHRERRLTSMERGIYLPNSTAEGIKAKLEDGILTILVAKEQQKNKTYSIAID
jgi:HSP20 family protein